jgi:hypothetical protein
MDMTRQVLDNLLWDAARLVERAFHSQEAWAGNLTAHIARGWRGLALALDGVLSTHRSEPNP